MDFLVLGVYQVDYFVHSFCGGFLRDINDMS